ncbi:MAG: hypothetical protein BGO05_05515 [Rhizobiales bacterium 63-7]|nr:phage tail protein [Hyphomicrobiales bacterium]OJU66658.1 MAG: hypothetical protein BGO05_05515 [Rhizobiales bacterium 63-7]
MLYMLGPLKIEVWPFNVENVDELGGTDFAIKPIAGAEQPAEYVGEGANELRLDGKIWPSERDGDAALTSLEVLTQMRVSGRPQYLMRGDGRAMGWYSVMSVAVRSSNLERDGIGRKVSVTIELRRSPGPASQDFFSIVSRLAG